MHLVGLVVAGQHVHHDVDAEAPGQLALAVAPGQHGGERTALFVGRPGRRPVVPADDHRRDAVVQAVGAKLLTELTDFAPPTIVHQAARLQSRQHFFNLVVTNVPGPQFPLYVLGRRMIDIFPMVPLAKNQGVCVGIMSYDGKVDFGLIGDYESMPHLDSLAEELRFLTAEWQGERMPDGRPRVPDDILQRMRNVSIEEAWGILRNHGYHNQFAGDWSIIDEDEPIVGRALTAMYLPSRPELAERITQRGQRERGQVGAMNSWPIDALQPGDVRRVVEPVPAVAAPARLEQADLVVEVERPHGHPRAARQVADLQQHGVHAGPSVASVRRPPSYGLP